MKLAEEIALVCGGPGSGRRPGGQQIAVDHGHTQELKTKVPGFAAFKHPKSGQTIHIAPGGSWSLTDAGNQRIKRGSDTEDLYRHFHPDFKKGDVLPGKYW